MSGKKENPFQKSYGYDAVPESVAISVKQKIDSEIGILKFIGGLANMYVSTMPGVLLRISSNAIKPINSHTRKSPDQFNGKDQGNGRG